MSKSFAQISILATAVAAVFLALPINVGSAAADKPRWASAHSHHKAHHKPRWHKRQVHRHRDWRQHETRRKVAGSRSVYRYRHTQPHRGRQTSLAVSPSIGGALVGALLGGLGGSQIGKGSGRTAAIIGGVAAGAVIGGSLGRSMEQSDRAEVQRTLESARTGQTVAWKNPDTGHRYEVTPTRTYRSADLRDCREYTTWVFMGGYEEQVAGTACRMPDGTWQRQPG